MSEHQPELDSIQQMESKKLEKQLKILVQEFEEAVSLCTAEKRLPGLYEKALKTLNDVCKKTKTKLQSADQPVQRARIEVANIKSDVAANAKKAKTLKQMSSLLLQKNKELYLKHEVMLDEEKA